MEKTASVNLIVKGYDEEQRRISGIATTPDIDRTGDIVEPMGAQYAKSIPLLLDHESSLRVGRVSLGKATKTGIPFEAWIPKVAEPGLLKDRVDLAWQEVKYGLLDTVSIGFRILNEAVERLKDTGGLRYLQTEILELSLVGIPAQQAARITAIKSAYAKTAPGRSDGNPPARARAPQSKGNTMKWTAEALAKLQGDREIKANRMEELRKLKADEGRSFTTDERQEFDGLDAQIEDMDDEIRVAKRHLTNIAGAVPVGSDRGSEGRRAPYGFAKKFNDVEPKFKGEEGLKRAVAHIVSMKALKDGSVISPVQVFDQMFGKTNPTMLMVMKTAVAGGGTDSGEWGAELVGIDNRYTGDFLDYLYGMTVFDQLPLREVPANVGIKGQDGAFTGYFVGQSKAIKVSKGDFSTTSTTPYKAAGLTVVSNELLEDSSPSALGIIGEGLREAVAQAVDTKFLSADAVSAGVSPAGILNGVSAVSTNGGDAQSIATDIKATFAPFITAKNTKGGFAWVMSPTTALALSLMKNALGQTEYPTLTPTGGTWQGYPVYTGDNVGSGDVILLKPSDIWRIGDTGMRLSLSDSAMIEQDDAPTGATDTPVAASATMVSMYQEDSTAIRVIRRISWGKRRSGAVQYVGDAAYGSEQS